MKIVDFDVSIDTDSSEYEECVSANNPKYVRSMPKDCTPRQFLDCVKQLYEKNITKRVSHEGIPKIIHQIWLGNSMPQEYEQFIQSWKTKHPNWEYRFWDEEKIKKEFGKLYNQSYFEDARRAGNFARMSDIARYEIINRFGGLYVDCDCLCIKPFDSLHERYDFYAGLEHLANGLVIGNAIFASKPNHPIIRRCIEKIKTYEHKDIDMKYWKGFSGYTKDVEEEFARTMVTTGPILLLHAFWKSEKNADIIFPPTYFYPFAEGGKEEIKQETFSCHYFKGVWKEKLKRKYEQKE